VLLATTSGSGEVERGTAKSIMILVRKNLQQEALVALNYFKSEKFQVN